MKSSRAQEEKLGPDGLPTSGYVRLASIIAPKGPLPISKSSWWEGVRSRRYPQPVKLGPRITVWRCEDIREFLAQPTTSKIVN